MKTASIILSLFFSFVLFGCDRALDDRYEGLVVVPVQEIPVQTQPNSTPNLEPNIIRVSIDIPRIRPSNIPTRALTPDEAVFLADQAALNAAIAESDATAADTSHSNALKRLEEAETALLKAQFAEQELALNTNLSSNGNIDVLDISALESESELSSLSLDPSRDTNPARSGIPRIRPTPFPRSFDTLDEFFDEQERLKKQAELAAEAARVAEAERLAAERVKAEQLAAAAAVAERLAAEAAAEEAARQAHANAAAEAAAAEAERLASIGATLPDPSLEPSISPLMSKDISLPLAYNQEPPIDTVQSLQTRFDEAGFNLAQIIAGTPAPALIVQRIPGDLGELDEARQHEIFIKIMLPPCLITNARIEQERSYILSSENLDTPIDQLADPVIRGLVAKYNAKTTNELLKKVQPIPISLCLAQSIYASSWGTSAATQEQTAIFGPWVRLANDSSVSGPAALYSNQNTHTILFNSLQTAADAFALHMNRHHSMENFRTERDRAKQKERLLSGLVAAEFMADFNQADTHITTNLIQIIRENRLNQYNLVQLNGPRQAIPVF